MTERVRRILVVDDEPDMVEWLTAFFEDHGFQTDFAYDGFVGFEKAKAGRPDVITLDITMDKESGVRMYRNLRGDPETARIPVIMITGMAREFKQFIGTRKQVPPPNAYFEKPVDKQALLNKINELF